MHSKKDWKDIPKEEQVEKLKLVTQLMNTHGLAGCSAQIIDQYIFPFADWAF